MWLGGYGATGSITSTKSAFREGDILFGKLRPYFHKVVSAPTDGVCSTDVLVLRSAVPELAGYVLAAVCSDSVVQECTAASEGTRMPRTSWKDLGAVEVPWPHKSAALLLSQEVHTVRAHVEELARQNGTMANLRDALLPQLMSGNIRVKDAEKTVGEVL
jgi:type I restriction enzyme S subunit